MDRNRLDEVKQTDLTESRINEEFVDWLKNKGPTYLLICLVGLLVILFVMRMRESRHQKEISAWQELRNSALPSALEDVANEYEGVDSIAALARIQAADSLMASVQADFPLEADPATEPDLVLTPEDREAQLARADRLYAMIADGDDGSLEMTLLVVGALNGRAAVAEAMGNLGEARTYYEQAAKRAEEHFPSLAKRGLDRANTATEMESLAKFPTDADIEPLRADDPETTPVTIDPAFNSTLLTPVGGAG